MHLSQDRARTTRRKIRDGFVTIAIIVFAAGHASAQGLSVTYGNQGIATLAYNGVTLADTNANGQDAFTVYEYERKAANGTVTDKYSWDGGYTTSWNSTTKTLTLTYDWGTVKCVYTQPTSTRLNMSVTVTNTTAGDTINGVNVFPLYVRFPNYPVGYDANTPHVGYTSDGPNVQVADYGTGSLALSSDDVTKNLYSGFYTISPDTANYKRYEIWTGTMPRPNQPPNYPVFNRPIAHGASDTFNVSLRFGATGSTGVALAPDVYSNFRASWPSQVTWPDHRSIGAIFLATSQTHPVTNPRGWFLNDPYVDITTPAGVSNLQQRLLQVADNSIPILQSMNSQGVIIWDVEGQEFSHPISYVGDPTQLSVRAPEMDSIADAFFQKFRTAGLRVGVCVRPQQLVTSPSPQQNEVANPATQIINKINYAKQRWGCSIFYVDSNGDTNAPYDASIFKQVADAEPGVLIIPEHANPKYYAYTVPYGALTNGATGDPLAAIWTYPTAFSAIYTADGDLTGQHGALVNSVKRGDMLMYRGWWSDPQNSQVQSIYTDAAIGTGLKAQYYNDPTGGATSFTTLALTRKDAAVNFNWASGASPGTGVNSSYFSTKWTGYLTPPFTDSYQIHVTSDDGARLYVNGQLLVDNWGPHAPQDNFGVISLLAGQKYAIELQYRQFAGGAAAKLEWLDNSGSLARQVIPAAALTPAP
ncbi:MAG: PA14 domain-containing protein [Capsulimonas sp.]|uniref:PA14 domain-containing protein n=1 Tax=Capsulimonas sp. TaxID=2494211 RepID=UPI003267801E